MVFYQSSHPIRAKYIYANSAVIKMDDDSPHFCMACGAPLRESDTFCTKCGTTVGSVAPAATRQTQTNRSEPNSNTLLLPAVLSAAWAIPAMIAGIFLIVSADYIVSLVDSGTMDILLDYGFTANDFVTLYVVIGALLVASGALAAIASVLAFLKKYYIIALIACIISSLLVIMFLVGIVGIIVAYFLAKSKHEFDNKTNIL